MNNNAEITRLGRDDSNVESLILTKLERLLERASGRSDGKIIKLPITDSRKRSRKADQDLPNNPANTLDFAAMNFDQWVESGEKLVVRENIIIVKPDESEIILGTNKNKPITPRNPYYIYDFKSLIDNFRIYFWVYALLHSPILVYLGSGLAGTFGYPGAFWMLTTLLVKIAIDASIVAFHIGKHYEKLIVPSCISIAIFYLLGGAFFLFNKILPLLKNM